MSPFAVLAVAGVALAVRAKRVRPHAPPPGDTLPIMPEIPPQPWQPKKPWIKVPPRKFTRGAHASTPAPDADFVQVNDPTDPGGP